MDIDLVMASQTHRWAMHKANWLNWQSMIQVESDGKQGVPRQEGVRNARLQQLGAPNDVCRDALNPGQTLPLLWSILKVQFGPE